MLAYIDLKQVGALIEGCPRRTAEQLIALMTSELAGKYLKNVDKNITRQLMEQVDPKVAAAVLEEVDEPHRIMAVEEMERDKAAAVLESMEVGVGSQTMGAIDDLQHMAISH